MGAVDARLAGSRWLAGEGFFSAADVMTAYSLTTQRYFGPALDLGPYPHVLRWLGDVAARPAYRRAMARGDPDMRLLLGAEAPAEGFMECGGVASAHWRK